MLQIARLLISNQVDELRMRVRELEERERKESKKLADEDALRKIRVAEETIEHLQKKLAATKQVGVFCICKPVFVCYFPAVCVCFF